MFPSSILRPGQDGYLKIVATGNYIVPSPQFCYQGPYGELTIEVQSLGTLYTGTWPATINWIKSDGTTTTSIATYLAANGCRTAFKTGAGIDTVFLWTNDGGQTIFGKLV